jgi:transcriptional regulator with XRE-family HTH domain
MIGNPEPNFELLKLLRKLRISQKMLARAIRISESKISNVVNGWTEPSQAEKERICLVLGVDEKKIFKGG